MGRTCLEGRQHGYAGVEHNIANAQHNDAKVEHSYRKAGHAGWVWVSAAYVVGVTGAPAC